MSLLRRHIECNVAETGAGQHGQMVRKPICMDVTITEEVELLKKSDGND